MTPTDTDRSETPWLDAQHFENRRRFPPEQLDQYAGQYVAWSWDGSRILASAEEREQMWDKLEAAGIDPHRVVFHYVDIA